MKRCLQVTVVVLSTVAAALKPSIESARSHAFHIFNEIQSAGRVFGSALNHNGYGFFPAIIPKGTLLYHGSRRTHPPTDVQWLAYEIEAFMEDEWNSRGYLHTYQASRDLHVLYIDGMAAAKSRMGPLDSQDLILRENKTGSWSDYMDEGGRARSICRLITPWGLDGFVRMEIGFEVVHCDFSQGLRLVDVTRTIMPDQFVGDDHLYLFQLARAVTEQFDTLGKDRLRIDFSSMISAYFYPIPLSGTDPKRPDLHRLAAVPLDHLLNVKKHVQDVCKQPRRFTVNWQAIADTIVSRFGEHLMYLMSEETRNEHFVADVQKLVLTYYDAPPLPGDVGPDVTDEAIASMQAPTWSVMLDMTPEGREHRIVEARSRCKTHHLLPAILVQNDWSSDDKLIYASLETVTARICDDLFQVNEIIHRWYLFQDPDRKALSRTLEKGKAILNKTMDDLNWTRWKEQRRCPVGQVWFAAMYPYGTMEDYLRPGCRTVKEMEFPRIGYWDLDYFTNKTTGTEV